MDIGSIIYDIYNWWSDNFNTRKHDDRELYSWLREQIKYESYNGGVVLQINDYDDETVYDYREK